MYVYTHTWIFACLFLFKKDVAVRAGEMVQIVKCMESDPSSHNRAGLEACIPNSSISKVDTEGSLRVDSLLH